MIDPCMKSQWFSISSYDKRRESSKVIPLFSCLFNWVPSLLKNWEMFYAVDVYQPSSLHLNKDEDCVYLMPDHHNPSSYI